MSGRSRVLTISPGAPFLSTLADALVAGTLIEGRPLDNPAWADAIVYLPTRRAARAFGKVLSERHGGRAQLLPRIIPLGDADEAEFELAAASTEPVFEAAEVLAPPIPPLERRLILARLIQGWAARANPAHAPHAAMVVPASPAEALNLAADLEKLMDALTIEGVPWDDLASAVDVEFSRYFALTLEFLRIVSERWPEILGERGASDPATRRNALISAEARRLLHQKPATPIIAAGSTGSIPSTAALLAAIAKLPNGAVVLPGLDLDLDEAGWRAIVEPGEADGRPAHGHPQAVMRRLLSRHLQLERGEVRPIGDDAPGLRARRRLLSEALRPAETTDSWTLLDAEDRLTLAGAGLDGIRLVEAADEREEALAIAVALRETLAEPGRTAMLVTPDRTLATRVSAELARWGLVVEDSAGTRLGDTPLGSLARLAADAAAADFHPARVLALLSHALVRLGRSRAEVERASAALEIGVLRGPAPGPGLEGLRDALAIRRAERSRHTPRPRRRLTPADWDAAADLVRRLADAFDEFTLAAQGDGELDLVALSAAHRRAIEALCEPGGDDIEDGASGALDGLFDDLAAADVGGLTGRFVDYPAFFAGLARQRTVPAARPAHLRITILGLLEARLLSADRVVLGGLDEGVWPPRVDTDAFLNRPMRATIGLSAPEQRIGQTAHDFVQFLGTADVVITRALKRGGAPMVPSRFLQRLKAFGGDTVWEEVVRRGTRYRELAHCLGAAPIERTPPRPAPRPSPALFPRALSVTEIETLVRDPYAIFARHILKLEPLESLAETPSAAARGTIIHDVLGRFAELYPQTLPADPQPELIRLGREAFAEVEKASPELFAEWWPRFKRLAAAFSVWEMQRRADVGRVHPEVSGSFEIPLSDGTMFRLRARADRIEQRRDGSFAIVDYKTGATPTNPVVYAGFSPQLTLEAAMLMQGAFKDVPAAGTTPDLIYVKTTGGRQPLNPCPIEPPSKGKWASTPVSEIVERHLAGLTALVEGFTSGEAAYLSRPLAQYARRYAPYDHLARVKEWSAADQDGEDLP